MKSASAHWLRGWVVLGLVAIVATPAACAGRYSRFCIRRSATSTAVDGPGFYKVGEDYTVYLVLSSVPFQNAPWYPWDVTKEYTAVVTVPVTAFSPPFFPNGLRSVSFGAGIVQVYEDTVPDADPADTSTYTNGLLVLWGGITGMHGSGSGSPTTLVMNFDTFPTIPRTGSSSSAVPE